MEVKCGVYVILVDAFYRARDKRGILNSKCLFVEYLI